MHVCWHCRAECWPELRLGTQSDRLEPCSGRVNILTDTTYAGDCVWSLRSQDEPTHCTRCVCGSRHDYRSTARLAGPSSKHLSSPRIYCPIRHWQHSADGVGARSCGTNDL